MALAGGRLAGLPPTRRKSTSSRADCVPTASARRVPPERSKLGARDSDRPPVPVAGIQLSLVDEFGVLAAGRHIMVPHSGARILAYVALAARPVHRRRLAGILWPDATDRLAAASLRTGLWHLRRAGLRLSESPDWRLALGSNVRVDLPNLVEIARRLRVAPSGDAMAGLSLLLDRSEVLPDWDEEWVVTDRERYRLLRLGALEHAGGVLLEESQSGLALDIVLAVTSTDPLCESACRLLVRCHLAEGNVANALRAYGQYRSLLRAELGIQPSRAMAELVRPFLSA